MGCSKLLFGNESFCFLLEVPIRATIMFILLFVTLRLMGKRAVRRLSVLELLIIISLSSAAGNPMLYREVSILKAATIFTVTLLFYGIIMKLITRSEKMEKVLEGRPINIIRNARAAKETIEHNELVMDEFFAALRNRQILHLSQIKACILETHGEVSLLLYSDDIKPGLPVWPDPLNNKTNRIPANGIYACILCGNTQRMVTGEEAVCDFCNKNDEWMETVS